MRPGIKGVRASVGMTKSPRVYHPRQCQKLGKHSGCLGQCLDVTRLIYCWIRHPIKVSSYNLYTVWKTNQELTECMCELR